MGKNYIIHISDRATYFVEDVEYPENAERIALEWFVEREPQIETHEAEPHTTIENVHFDINNNDIMDDLCRILEHRASCPDRSQEMRLAYNNALCMLLYALNGDRTALAQFDEE
jgi:hypothetical protein